MYTIEIENVVKKFKEKVVLDHVSLNCEAGKKFETNR